MGALTYSLAVLGVVFGLGGMAAAQEPERVTTDSADYCAELQLRLAEEENVTSGPPRADVQQLGETGQRLCQQGQIRPGIAHLRTALRIIHRSQNGTLTAPR